MDKKLSSTTKRKKDKIIFKAWVSSAQYEQFLSLHKLLYMDRASIIRFSVLQRSRDIVSNVKGMLDSLDRLGPAIASSGEAIAHAIVEVYKDQPNPSTRLQNLNDLLNEHVALQIQLEDHMRKLISLMAKS